MGRVTETSDDEVTLEHHAPGAVPVPVCNEHRPNRLYQALAWVGIAAGSLFILATVFFSGYVLGMHAGGGFHHHGPHRMMLQPFGGPQGPWGPGRPMGPGNDHAPNG